MKDPTIALCIIAKDREKQIIRLLESTQKQFDLYCLADTGSTDKTIQVFEKWCKDNQLTYKTSKKKYPMIEMEGKKILGNFSMARNESFKLAKGMDYAMWLDTDDVLYNPDNIKPILKQLEENKIDLALMTYDYSIDGQGNRLVVQERERIINLRKKGKWVNPVHESYQMDTDSITKIDENSVRVIHKRNPEEFFETSRRNNVIMTNYLKDNDSPVMRRLLAYDHWEYKEYDQAIYWYKEWLKEADGDLEVLYQVYIKMAVAYLGLGNTSEALTYSAKAIEIFSDRADGYLRLAECFMALKQWDEVLINSDKVLKIGKPNTSLPINEAEYTIYPLEMKSIALMSQNKLEEALGVLEQLIAMTGESRFFNNKLSISEEQKRIKFIKGLGLITDYLQSTNNKSRLIDILSIIPNEMFESDLVRSLIAEIKHDWKKATAKIELKGSKTIHIYAGQFFENWDGNSDIEGGIGGSEGMTILLARNLAKLGNKVTVFNECIPKEIDGVRYERWEKWDRKLRPDVFISLRKPEIFTQMIDAKKQFLWLHDTDYSKELSPAIWYSPNKIITVSEYHKDVVKERHGLKDDSKFWVARNAVNEKVLSRGYGATRNKNKIIYASSYDRGLDFILDNWKTIKERLPYAELHVYYGWNTFDALMENRGSSQMREFKKVMVEKLKQKDVYEHGRVSQGDLYQAFAESNVWFYPTSFTEVSCITAMTAQCMGAFPVCTPVYALKETVQHGVKLFRDKIIDGLVHQMENPNEDKRKKMQEWALKKFDALDLAKDLDLLFNTD